MKRYLVQISIMETIECESEEEAIEKTLQMVSEKHIEIDEL